MSITDGPDTVIESIVDVTQSSDMGVQAEVEKAGIVSVGWKFVFFTWLLGCVPGSSSIALPLIRFTQEYCIDGFEFMWPITHVWAGFAIKQSWHRFWNRRRKLFKQYAYAKHVSMAHLRGPKKEQLADTGSEVSDESSHDGVQRTYRRNMWYGTVLFVLLLCMVLLRNPKCRGATMKGIQAVFDRLAQVLPEDSQITLPLDCAKDEPVIGVMT